MDIQQVVKQSLPARRTTLDKLGPSFTRMIRISTVICYASNHVWVSRGVCARWRCQRGVACWPVAIVGAVGGAWPHRSPRCVSPVVLGNTTHRAQSSLPCLHEQLLQLVDGAAIFPLRGSVPPLLEAEDLARHFLQFCRKVRFLGKIQKFGLINSITYRLPNSRKSNFATEPLRLLPVCAEESHRRPSALAREVPPLSPHQRDRPAPEQSDGIGGGHLTRVGPPPVDRVRVLRGIG